MGKFKMGAKAKHPVKTMMRVLKDVFEHRIGVLVFVIIAILVVAGATVYSANFIGEFIDNFVEPLIGVKDPDWMPAIISLAKFAAVVLLSVIFNAVMSLLMVSVAQGSLYNIRNKMFRHMEMLPIAFFDRTSHGSIMSRFSNDTDTLNQLISNGLVQLLSAFVTVIVVFISMFINSWQLTLIVVAFIGVLFLATKLVAGHSGKNFAEQQKNLGSVNGFIEEMINGQRVIKVFCHEEEAKKDFDVLNEKLNSSMSKANSWANSMGPVSNNIGNLQYVVLVLIGAVIAIRSGGIYTIGALAAFLQLARSFSNNIGQMSNQLNTVLIALAGAERIYELEGERVEEDNGNVTLVNLDESGAESSTVTGSWGWKVSRKNELNTADEVKFSIDQSEKNTPKSDEVWKISENGGEEFKYVPLLGEVILKNVTFGYEPDKIVLHDISLYAKPGQKIAFVGSTGAGKTTITNLLNRFYNIQKGIITFDGINIMDIKLDDLRHSLGMVLQDTNLFSGTIKENIRFGKLDATDEEVIAAAKLANADSFINMLPDKYETVISNSGEELSQGQRQLLSIARAAISNPPVLIMDEATSSIDTRTEALVQSGMDKLMQNRTVFVIAHRLSTVRNSDAIMVLEHGRIIERGSHEDLIKARGVYYQLYTGASELS